MPLYFKSAAVCSKSVTTCALIDYELSHSVPGCDSCEYKATQKEMYKTRMRTHICTVFSVQYYGIKTTPNDTRMMAMYSFQIWHHQQHKTS